MKATSSIILAFALSLLGALSAGCDDACRPDNTCLKQGFICDFDDVCRRSCARDTDCGGDAHCAETSNGGVCREGPSPTTVVLDAGTTDAGGSGCVSGVGSEGCACYPNATCDFGYACMSGLCVDARGQQDQPCFDNGTCEGGLDCVGRLPLDRICRPAELGAVGQPCFDVSLRPMAQPCRSLDAICEAGLCLGGMGDACTGHAECQRGFGCEAGRCTRGRGPCDVRADCDSSQFCCGELGTAFADDSACPAGVSRGECFDAPPSTYAVPCGGHDDCAPAPVGSPRGSRTSLCMPWQGFVCSAPCDVEAQDPGCPNQWSCETSFLGCMNDEDCGVEGLACVGAAPSIGRLGRCRCDLQGSVMTTCTSTNAAAGQPTSTCTPIPGDGAYCVVDAHCVPPLP